ncbi:MAG TPA: hypothetical protein VJ697_04685 [Nitrososphaeraceae archaeon]|nr:hypothetical protein [Nitrososphaeraceae archaeon]
MKYCHIYLKICIESSIWRTCLGLYISNIVESNGGKIYGKNNDVVGAEFGFTLSK